MNPECGIRFEIRNMFGNMGTNGAFFANSTTCPRCKQSSRIVDFVTDDTGQVYFQGLFEFINNIKKPETLKKIKGELDAADDNLTARELVESLAEIDPGFAKFTDIIQSVPIKSLPTLINLLATIIMVVLTYQNLKSSNRNHKENFDLQKSQIELSREEFEYHKDNNQIKEMELQIEALREQFNNEIKNSASPDQPSTKKPRNSICSCGSGKRFKHCCGVLI